MFVVRFEWVTPPFRIWPKDLMSSKLWLMDGQPTPPSILHFLGAPQRAIDVLDSIDAIAKGDVGDGSGKGWDPQLVFEPVPVSLSFYRYDTHTHTQTI
jgi:hypothetical protein